MILRELFYFDKETMQSVEDDMYDAELDQTPVKRSDTRKTRLTLSQINRARKGSEISKKEKAKELDFIRQMYGAAGEAAAGIQSVAKVDKSLLTKAQWKQLREQRRLEKQHRLLNKSSTLDNTQNNNVVVDQPAVKHQHFDAPVKKTPPPNSKKTAFVLGNGTSRKPINLDLLKVLGKVYGCNALYRSFDPDYLIAVDVKMVLELNKAGYQRKNHNVWTNPNKSLLKYSGFNFFNPSKGWSSGPTALWLASQHGYDQIYILGFDYKGLNEGTRFNNMYADTTNYKKSTEGATFFGNWMRQTQHVIRDHPHIQYTRVIAPDNYNPPELNKFDNYSTVAVDEFIKFTENSSI